jgi:arsenate reductase
VSLARRPSAEFAGTGLLVAAVVGSGIAAARLSPQDVGLQLLENAIATALALGALILTFGPVSGAHLNPVVSTVDWWLGRRTGTGLTGSQLGGYIAAQTLGAIGGAVLADLMFGLPAVAWSHTRRSGGHLWLAETVATAGLVLLVVAVARSGRTPAAPAAVGAYIGAAYWWTSSTSFANPAVTVGRMFSDTFAGVAPGSVPAFVVAQLVGGVLAAAAIAWWDPDACRAADDVVVPHTEQKALPDDHHAGFRVCTQSSRRWPTRTPTRCSTSTGVASPPAMPPSRPNHPPGPSSPPSACPSTALAATTASGATWSSSNAAAPPSPDQRSVRVSDKPGVLFVCVHNAGRSQMAAGWLRHLAGDSVEVRSAGSEPAEQINPIAVQAMAEVGIDITAEEPKKLDYATAQDSDVIVTMGCGDTCPVFPGKRYEDWQLTDPAGQPIDVVRTVRDQIRGRVEQLLAALAITPHS